MFLLLFFIMTNIYCSINNSYTYLPAQINRWRKITKGSKYFTCYCNYLKLKRGA